MVYCLRLTLVAIPIMFVLLMLTAAAAYRLLHHPEWWSASNLSIEHVTIPVANLPAELQGLRITHLSDLHFGPPNTDDIAMQAMLRQVHSASESFDPHLVLVSGDIVHNDPRRYAEQAADWLSKFHSRCHDSVLIAFGNHDFRFGNVNAPGQGVGTGLVVPSADYITQVLESRNLTVLRNEAITLSLSTREKSYRCDIQSAHNPQLAHTDPPDGLAYLNIGGVDDFHHGIHINAAFRDVDASVPYIAVSHTPDSYESFLKSGHAVDVILSGHTHGGQLCIPGAKHHQRGVALLQVINFIYELVPPVWRSYVPGHRFMHIIKHWHLLQGLHSFALPDYPQRSCSMYISRGLTDVRRRVFCDPEIALLTLVRA
jgi:uncharacterized protein